MNSLFTRLATEVAHLTGRPLCFLMAATIIIVWALTGPLFNFSDTWQLIVNTGTTIITFLMVFIIQNTQNRDGAAVQTKLDELIRTSSAQNRFIGIEHLTDEEIEEYRQSCSALAAKAADRARRGSKPRVASSVTRQQETRNAQAN
jgi:low affinity Fe/Cu permease